MGGDITGKDRCHPGFLHAMCVGVSADGFPEFGVAASPALSCYYAIGDDECYVIR